MQLGLSPTKEYKLNRLSQPLIVILSQNLSISRVTVTSREATGDRDQVSLDHSSRATSQLSGRRARHPS
jgi:hypothetical protein